MTRPPHSLPPAYFESLYDADPDPWRFATSPYEAAKYAATLGALGPRYDHALEVGCAIGVLTERLAPRCGRLLALDVAEKALAAARARCAALLGVTFRRARFPAEAPPGPFDLILLSEVVYYWSPADIEAAAAAIEAALRPGGDLLLVHWIRETDYPLSGDEATRRLRQALGGAVRAVAEARTDSYRLDLWRRTGAPPTRGSARRASKGPVRPS
ncbi:MAG: methyltransferase domain-containing protein [Geminicoccaceae bacterium]|nr:methyltransferase domain-containing protein [Geminicoccaceae bacterium]